MAFEYIKLLTGNSVEERDGKPLPAYEAIRNQNGTVIRFTSLSDGYRNVIKIVTDIATRIRILKTFFPKIQFVCATHSPFIIQSLEQGKLIGLNNIEGEEMYQVAQCVD